MFITLLIIKLIFFCSINFNIHIFAEIKKQKTMYQVIYKEGINTSVIELPTKKMANNHVNDKASELNLMCTGYDADGLAWACDNETRPSQEIFIFEITEII